MTYEELKRLGSIMREEVREFCQGQMPTIDEVESLAVVTAVKCWACCGKPHWNRKNFERFICNSVRQEILRTCI